VANGVKGVETSFYKPHRESAHSGVTDPDMSDQETRYVQKMLLKLGLTPDMSGAGT
jgi:hypothetical protein